MIITIINYYIIASIIFTLLFYLSIHFFYEGPFVLVKYIGNIGVFFIILIFYPTIKLIEFWEWNWSNKNK